MTGCASISYQEPESGPTANVRFVTDSNSITVVRYYSDMNCSDEQEWMRLRKGYFVNSDPKSLDMPLGDYHKNAFKEFKVDSTKPLTVMFDGDRSNVGGTFSCGSLVNLHMDEGKDYELNYSISFGGCTTDVYEIIENGRNSYKKDLIAKFDNKVPKENQACLDAFEKTRWY